MAQNVACINGQRVNTHRITPTDELRPGPAVADVHRPEEVAFFVLEFQPAPRQRSCMAGIPRKWISGKFGRDGNRTTGEEWRRELSAALPCAQAILGK